jgi:replicative DNA helicase
LLGHLIGDGCMLPRHATQYTTRERELAGLVADLARAVFGAAVVPRIRTEQTWQQVYLSAARHLTHGVRNPVADWLDRLGAFGLRAFEKRVPEVVFRQPPTAIATFLRHLWATDGCLRAGTGRQYPVVRFDSTSPGLTADVASLLLRLGINAKVRAVPMGEKGRPSYRLDVTGRDEQIRFVSLVGGVGARRRAEAARILSRLEATRANTNRDVIPQQAWHSLVRPAMAAAGVTTRALQARLGTAYCGSTLYRTGIGRARAAAVAEIVGSETLASLSTSDVYWDEVVSVEADGEEEVYDLTVEELHNFVADDVVVHNSIEQDADLVVFIYRDEYYNEDSDQQGLAEVILAKHRNGPTDSVKLSFLKRYAKFADLAAT